MKINKGQLQAVADELAIRNLVARYSDAVGRRDEEAWSDTWTDDGTWQVGPMRASGRVEVVKTWSRLMDLFQFVTQVPQYGLLELAGDAASGRWHVVELGWPKQGAPSYTLGCYEDSYRRTDAGWRFSERRFQIVYTGAPDLSGTLIGTPASAS